MRVGYIGNKYQLLPEEQKMLNEIGRMISLALERKTLSDHLEDLQDRIVSRTKELEEQTPRLSVVGSYLERVNKGWDESKVRLETLFAAIPDEMALIDRNRKVVMTNRRNVESGNACYQVFFDREHPCRNCRLARIIKEKTPLTLKTKQGDKYLQVYAMSIYNQQQEVDGIIEFFRDITLENVRTAIAAG